MLTIIDVSSYQPVIDWHRVAHSGIGLAFVKASEGANYVNPVFAIHRADAARAGVRVGAYHFAQPGSNKPEHEARHFAAVVRSLGRRELRPVLDLEVGDTAATEAWARAFNHTLVRLLGVTPILYSYSAYLAAMGASRPVGGGLWLASYGRNDGRDYGARVPKPWKGWVAHQFTSKGRVAGIDGFVDVSHAPKLRPLLAHPVSGRL